jgi:glutathione S-transferase
MAWDSAELMHGQHLVRQLVRLPAHNAISRQERARKELIAAFRILDTELGGRRFIAGEHFSMGDIPIGVAEPPERF